MLASGGSVSCCIDKLKQVGVKEENITLIHLVSCDVGIEKVLDTYPNVKIITAVIDPELNDKKYIIPGLGDFGDRFYGTIHE
jgi:uracil phosphoribosyltransferase